MNPTYRPEIDGLRALAVLAVVFYHLDASFIRGGFAGVDIFFVISGFLITSIIASDIKAGRFSLAEFYERRARRILPALCAVCAVTLIGAVTLLYTDDTIEAAQSVLAAMLFVSNIFFWTKTGYFATDVDEKPLLHTWSLGVEEQFYIIVPFLLVALYKYVPLRVAAVMGGVTVISLALSEIAVHHVQNAAFYLLPFRFWELGLGSVMALVMLPQPKFKNADNIIGIGGFLVALYSLLSVSEKEFPGFNALNVCAGAMAILWVGARSSWTQKVLANRPMVLTGKLSYSLYLWHWPVLAFVHYRFENAHGLAAGAAIFVVSYALAYLSWKYIETPFRNRSFLSRQDIFLASVMAMIALGAASFSILHFNGLPNRFTPEIAQLKEAANDRAVFMNETCIADDKQSWPPECYFGYKDAHQTNAIIWGDSHAAMMVPALEGILSSRSIRGLIETRQSCPAFAGDYKWRASDFGDCQAFNKKVFDLIVSDPQIKYVFLAGRWSTIAKRFDKDPSVAREKFAAAMQQTSTLLSAQGKQVFYIAQVPEPGFDVPRCLSRQKQFGAAAFSCTPPQTLEWTKANMMALSAFEQLQKAYPVYYPANDLCGNEGCYLSGATGVFYADDDHLSKTGAGALSVGIEAAFGPKLPYN